MPSSLHNEKTTFRSIWLAWGGNSRDFPRTQNATGQKGHLVSVWKSTGHQKFQLAQLFFISEAAKNVSDIDVNPTTLVRFCCD